MAAPLPCCSYEGDYGSHQQACDAAERLPGLWEVPSEWTQGKWRWKHTVHCGCRHLLLARSVVSPAATAVWRMTELGGPYQMDPGFTYCGCCCCGTAPGRLRASPRPPPGLHFRLRTKRPVPTRLPHPAARAVGMAQAANASAYEILRANFLAAYNGTRAPLPLYVHSFFLREGNNQRDVERFLGAGRFGWEPRSCAIQKCSRACPTPSCPSCPPSDAAPAAATPADFALAQPHTYAITMRQLIAYLQHPVPAEQLTPAALGCGRPGGAGPDPSA